MDAARLCSCDILRLYVMQTLPDYAVSCVMHSHLEVVRNNRQSNKPDLAALQRMQVGCACANSLKFLISVLPNTCWHQVSAVLSGGQFQKLMVATPSVATFRPSSQKQCQLIASFKSRAWPQLPDATIEEVAGSPSSSPHATSKFPIRLEVAPPHPAMLRLLQRRTACLSNRRSFCSTSCSLSSGMCVCV